MVRIQLFLVLLLTVELQAHRQETVALQVVLHAAPTYLHGALDKFCRLRWWLERAEQEHRLVTPAVAEEGRGSLRQVSVAGRE